VYKRQLYSPSHAWAARQADGAWRVGITKFATRMLGDMVECGWEVQPGAAVACGQVVGWLEGFKAISDVYGIVDGEFLGANPLLKTKSTTVNKDPHGHGWLYAATGTPESRCLDVHAYVKLLDKTIDKILEREHHEESQ
jgi:glycine cleavage system H protein